MSVGDAQFRHQMDWVSWRPCGATGKPWTISPHMRRAAALATAQISQRLHVSRRVTPSARVSRSSAADLAVPVLNGNDRKCSCQAQCRSERSVTVTCRERTRQSRDIFDLLRRNSSGEPRESCSVGRSINRDRAWIYQLRSFKVLIVHESKGTSRGAREFFVRAQRPFRMPVDRGVPGSSTCTRGRPVRAAGER